MNFPLSEDPMERANDAFIWAICSMRVFREKVKLQEKQANGKPVPFVLKYDTDIQSLIALDTKKFREHRIPTLVKCGMSRRCRFLRLWNSQQCAYRVVHHEFSMKKLHEDWDVSLSAMIIGAVTTDLLAGEIVYTEFYPISSQSLFNSMQATLQNTVCEFCKIGGCLDKCESCDAVFCSPKHRRLHDNPVDAPNPRPTRAKKAATKKTREVRAVYRDGNNIISIPQSELLKIADMFATVDAARPGKCLHFVADFVEKLDLENVNFV